MIYPISIFTLDFFLQRKGCVCQHVGTVFSWEGSDGKKVTTPNNQSKLLAEYEVGIILEGLGLNKREFETFALSPDNNKTQ